MNHERTFLDSQSDRSHPPDLDEPACALCHHVQSTIGAQRPETGGILLGPVASHDITEFYFDVTASCSRATYSPDHITLRRKMKEEWLPAGLDMKGFVHSHPGEFDRLSHGDLVYIRHLLEKNPEMPFFAAPIVIPHSYRLRAFVVMASQPNVQRPTQLQLF